MKTRKVCADGKNGGHKPSRLGQGLGRRQAVRLVFKFDSFNSKAHLGFLNGFMVLITTYQ